MTNYKLQDLVLFSDKVLGGLAQGKGLILDDKTLLLPVDGKMIYKDKPSLHLQTENSDGLWQCSIAPLGWDALNLKSYIKNGTLEFNIKGSMGNEDFSLFLNCKDSKGKDVMLGDTNISKYVNIKKDWTHVSITLSEYVDTNVDVMLNTFKLVVFKAFGEHHDINVWINDMKIVSPDDEECEMAVKVNQTGYVVNANKYALVSGPANNFKIAEGTNFTVKNNEGSEVYSGQLVLVSENDETVSGERVLKADFSEVKNAGTYYVEVSGLAKSPSFRISDEIYDKLLVDACRYYYYQRAGFKLDEKYAGVFKKGAGIPQDSSVTLLSEMDKIDAKKYDVSGGWYDAGDYGKYTNAAATAVSEILWGYEMFPDQFKDNMANIPESGNGIADILDEVKYELDFILRMQDKVTGGFYAHVWDQNYDATPDKALDMVRYIQDEDEKGNTHIKPTTHTADCVATLAQSYFVYKDINPDFAKTMLKAAEEGYKYLEKTPEFIGSYISQPYYDPDDENDRLWAAAAMFRATGKQKYNDYFLKHYKNFAPSFAGNKEGHEWGYMEQTAFYTYFSAENADKEALSWYMDTFNRWSDSVLNRIEKSIWGISLNNDGYKWGSNSVLLDTVMDLYIGNKVLGNNTDRCVEAMRSSLNYILGINPMALCYVSGYGEHSVEHIYSNMYNNDDIDEIPDGYLSGGPNMNQGRIFSRFNGKAYVDSGYEWTTNEHTIYWNSVLIFSVAACNFNK